MKSLWGVEVCIAGRTRAYVLNIIFKQGIGSCVHLELSLRVFLIMENFQNVTVMVTPNGTFYLNTSFIS